MRIIFIFLLYFFSNTIFADVYVHPYQRSDGTTIQGYYRIEPNSTRNDNYSTQGNQNPYTGAWGNKPRDNEYNNSQGW